MNRRDSGPSVFSRGRSLFGFYFVAPLTIDRSKVHSLVECRGEHADTTDLLQGTLDLLILRTLALEPMHGWGIAQRIQQVSKDALQIGQGSLYPALHRLEYKGWIQAEWGASENNRRAKYYSLTRTGKSNWKPNWKTGNVSQQRSHWCSNRGTLDAQGMANASSFFCCLEAPPRESTKSCNFTWNNKPRQTLPPA